MDAPVVVCSIQKQHRSSTMKKIFSKFDKNEKLETSTGKEGQNYVGKSFSVGKSTVTVEDVLAEGQSVAGKGCLLHALLIQLGHAKGFDD